MSKKIGVRKAMQPQIDSSGKLSYVMDVGGRRGGGGGRPTKRERIGGALGGAVGVLGALTGSNRSLGQLAGSMYAGGTQGSMLGRGLAGKTVSRTRRARAKLDEDERQENARLAAEHQKEFGASGRLFHMDENNKPVFGSSKDLAQQRRAYLSEMGQQLADQKLDEKMGIKNFRQFQQKHGPLMQEALGRPEGMAAITSLMERPDALLQGAANVKNVGPAQRVVSNAPVLPVQSSNLQGSIDPQIAPDHKDHDSELQGMADATGAPPQNSPPVSSQDDIAAMIAASMQQQEIIDQAQGTTPGL